MDVSSLGRKVREIRKQRGLTLDGLAVQSGSSKSYLWELENKENARPSGEKLAAIAAALGVTSEFLLDENRTTPTVTDADDAFFRKFERADPAVKDKLRKILDVLDDE
jgi:transcriptional regulator with XRE-family HTH domain